MISDAPFASVNGRRSLSNRPCGGLRAGLAYFGFLVVAATAVYGQQPAAKVWGQLNLTSNAIVSPTASSLYNPIGTAVDGSGNLYVADNANLRVLYYAVGSTTATRVYGDGGLYTTACTPRHCGVGYFYGVNGVALDSSGNLYIATPNWVTYYAGGSTTYTRIYNGGVTGATALTLPANAVVVDGSGNVYIADGSRVVYFPAGSTTATRVYGQAGSFTTNTANNGGVSADSLSTPRGLALDASGNLYVADSANNRVLYFPAGSTTATQVWGQPDFVSSGSGTSATALFVPAGLALDPGGNLYVADSSNNRVLYFAAGSTTATKVWGQPGFTSSTTGSSATTLNSPRSVTRDSSGNLYVADFNNNRVLEYLAAGNAYTISGPASGPLNTASATFTVTPNGAFSGTITVTPSGGGLSTPIVLTFNDSYAPQTFTITPTAAGQVLLTPTNSQSFPDVSALNYATPPTAPTITAATGANAQATVTFTAPDSTGGFAIASYTVTSTPGNFTATGAASPIVVTGLANKSSYTFTVKATSSAGTGPASAASSSTYVYPTPTVTSVSPASGPLAGGTTVTVTGTGFTGATGVTFAGVAATNVTVASDTSITATLPAGTAGTASLLVTTPGATNVANTLYTYFAVPGVTLVSPASGPLAGATAITITGTGFTGATGVTIGGAAATTVVVVSSTSITAKTPARPAGAASVLVTTPGGTSAANTLYSYLPVPTVSSVSPSSGPLAGGAAITITGTGFTGATAVTFGGTALTSVVVVSDTSITAVTPVKVAGTTSVLVTTPGGTNVGTILYTNAAAPTVTALSPASGPVAGGTSITITGTAFSNATGVTLGGTAVTSFTVVSSTSITAVTASSAAGAGSVLVTTPSGTNVASQIYTYVGIPAVTARNFAYIPNSTSNTVSVINTATNTVVATIPVGTYPYSVAINPAGTRVYVTNYSTNNVSVIDTATNTVVATVAVGTNPFGVTINPEGTLAYVLNIGAATISIIDTVTNTVKATVPGNSQPTGIAFHPSGAYYAVTNANFNQVSIINAATNSITSQIAMNAPGQTPQTRGIVFNPAGSVAYVTNAGGNTVSVINTTTRAVSAITMPGGPMGIAIHPAGTLVYVTVYPNNVVVINTATNTVTATLTVGASPNNVSFSPSGAFAYVPDNANHYVSVIDTTTNAVTATIPVGKGPNGLGPFIGNIPPIFPATGWSAGGTLVTISGTSFTGATGVTIGGAPATNVTVVSDNAITATTPAGALGTASVVVTNSQGSSLDNTFYTYANVPTLTAISPSGGGLAGGTAVTLTGTALLGTTGVTIGGTAATNVVVVSDTSITATAPAGAAGASSVQVTEPAGTNAANSLYTYYGVPTVTSITPNGGVLTAGTAVTITGTSFTGTTNVTIGGTVATSIVIVSSTSITATMPAGTAGTASVLVTTPGGTNAANTLYTYFPKPTVTLVSPASAPELVATAVTITGTGFTGATAVTFGGTAATSVTVVSDTSITALTPAKTTAAASVLVTTPGGTNAANTLYTYTSVPGAPTVGIATAGNGQASLAFTAPAWNGGSAITVYTVTSTPGSFTGTGTATPVVVAGLTNGTSYTFTVRATSALGTSLASAVSNAVTPAVGMTADRVYGEFGSFTAAIANNGGISANSLNGMSGVAADSSGGVYIADGGNNRILHYAQGSTTADIVYGQGGSFTTNTLNNGGISASSLYYLVGISVDSSGGLYVADQYNARVLHYPQGSTTADRVYGQGDSFTTGSAATSIGGLNRPNFVVADSGGVYVADTFNNRVLHFSGVSTTPDRVYGQGGVFTTGTANKGGVSANSLSSPEGLRVDSSGGLYVADYSNNRVLHYPSGSTTADQVYGQGGSFTTSTANSGGISATGLLSPYDVDVDGSGGIYVTEISNNRVLHYQQGSTTADRVYGQGGSFTSNTANIGGRSAGTLSGPIGMNVDSAGGFYVTDYYNARVLHYPAPTSTAPGAPTIGTATSGTGQASITFTAPASNGGAAITGYTVTSTPGNLTAAGAASPIVVTGLTGGTAYTFTVTATSTVGTGTASAASNAVTPVSVPGTPAAGTATAGYTQATVAFTAPVSNGGSAITSYRVTSTPGSLTATAAASPITVTGLTNGTAYTFTLTATNAIGTSAASAASNSITPALSVPGAPTVGTASAGIAQVSLAFTAPAYTGGSTITGYTVTSTPGSFTGTGAASPVVVTGLTNGTSYTFTVTATNAIGTGSASVASNAVTPAVGMTADRVYGQAGSFTTGTSNKGGLSASSMSGPECGLASDSLGGVYVGDYINNRVLHFPLGSTTADGVYGQGGSFTANTINNGGISANSLNYPCGVAVDGSGGLYVADIGNNRVLHFPQGSTTADQVYGQSGSFTSNTANNGGVTANSLNTPQSVMTDGSGGIYIADTPNSRVLHFAQGSTTADRVYGQGGSFTSNTANKGGISANSLFNPEGFATDANGGLYVADDPNHRVLHFPQGSTTADQVYGQGGAFTSNTANNGGVSASSLSRPFAVAVDAAGGIYVPEFGNNRVLHFPQGSTIADRVYGQGGSFTSNGSGLSATALTSPAAVALDSSGGLYVGEWSNSHVLHFPSPNSTAPGAPTIGTVTFGNGQATVSFTVPASNGGAAITVYTVTSTPGNITATGTTSPIIVTGLTNGTAYTFAVTATSSVGTSPTSAVSTAVTPATVPGAPVIGTATVGAAGTDQATVSFTAPASNGGSAITGYTVTSAPAGGTDSNAGTTALSHMVTGLTNGTAYTFTVKATNIAGTSAASAASNSVTIALLTTADRVYGQGGVFTTGTVNKNGISATSSYYPFSTGTDSSGGLYVADWSNNRVLHYPSGSTTADRVYGQGGVFTTNTANKTAISANSLSSPGSVAEDSSGGVYITDYGNNRVLHYPSGSTTADRVYGQGGSFTTVTANTGGISATSIRGPFGVAVDSSGGIFVGDHTNNRVLHYPSGSTTADQVYGQSGSFTTATPNKGGLSADSLNYPEGVAVDGSGGLYVADFTNNRVLHYPSGSTTADQVYGQGGSFTSGIANNSGISANSLSSPQGVMPDSSGGLYVTDDSNNRVLHYPYGSTMADRVYGQGGAFTSGTLNNGGITANSLSIPGPGSVDSSGGLYVADWNNNRVLHFPAPPATLPGVPTIGTVTFGNGQATVSFTTPVSNGGSAITTYTVTSSPGGLTGTGTTSPIVVTGLTNGTAYTFTVTATNAVGSGTSSFSSIIVTPATVPDAPTMGGATPGNAQASVTFTAPASDGGSTITGYTVTSSPGGITGTGAASPIVVAGLTNGTAYTFTVTATNAAGTSSDSAASTAVIPVTTPGAPTMGTAAANSAQASVNFTAPASNGGSAITGYTVTSSPGNFTGTGTVSPILVTGLTNGTAYSFTVTATNGAGTGVASAASNGVTPSAPAGQPAYTLPNPSALVAATGAGNPVNVGARFTPTSNINVTALGFYADSAVTLSEVVTLYDPSGAVLASVTVPVSSATIGNFYYQAISPVTISAGQTYTVSSWTGNNGYNFSDYSSVTAASSISNSNSVYLFGAVARPSTVYNALMAYLGPNFLFTGGAAAAGLATVTVSSPSVAANGSAAATVTVTLYDSGGLALPGKTVMLAKSGGSSVISAASGPSNSSGVVTFTVTNTVAEATTYTATDTTDSVVIPATAVVTFTAGTPTAGQSTVSASAASVIANGSASSTVTVTLKDAKGNPVAGKTVTLAKSGGSSVISAASGPSNSSGVVTFTVTDTVVEATTYSATDTTDSVGITAIAVVTFTAGTPTAGQSTVSASAATVPANGSSTATITVTLRDAFSNPVAGKTVTLAQGGGSSVISAVSGASSNSGVVTFTVSDAVAEIPTYTASDTTDGVTIRQTASVVFTPLMPVITAFTPIQGPAATSTTVVITGSGFTNASAVAFGGVAAGSFTVNSDTQITASAPTHAAGAVAITVTTSAGTATAGSCVANCTFSFQ